MANPKHLALLKEDIEAWNEWRKSLSGPAFDSNFSSAFQSGPGLSHAVLSHANLSKANLTKANLSGTILSYANLSGADLTGTILTRAMLSGANLTKANLTDANLADAVLSGANLFNVMGLTQIQIEEAYGNRTTRLPEGLEYPAHWLEQDDDGVEVEVSAVDVSIEADPAEITIEGGDAEIYIYCIG